MNEHGFQTATCFSDHLTYRFFFFCGETSVGYEDSTWQLLIQHPQKPAKTCQVFAHPLPFNVIPHIDSFQSNGYTKVRITGPGSCRVDHRNRGMSSVPKEIRRKMTKTMESSLKFNGDLPKKTFFWMWIYFSIFSGMIISLIE